MVKIFTLVVILLFLYETKNLKTHDKDINRSIYFNICHENRKSHQH